MSKPLDRPGYEGWGYAKSPLLVFAMSPLLVVAQLMSTWIEPNVPSVPTNMPANEHILEYW
jgi:hypothetical protein